MDSIKAIRQQLQTILDSVDDKPTIENIGALNRLVDNIEAEHKQLQDEQKDLLKDYKELIKHTSFQPTGTETQEVPEQQSLDFGDFLKTYQPTK